MRVLHLSSGNLFGGVETLLVTLARERALCPQMEPSFALCFEGRVADKLRAVGAEVHILGAVKIRFPWTVFNARRQLKRLLEAGKFDAVVCHMLWAQFIFAPVVKSLHLPQVFGCHDIPKGTHWLERLARFIKPDLAITNSLYTQERLPKLYPGVKSNVLFYPVSFPKDFDRVAARTRMRSSLNLSEDAVVIVQASRLQPWKGVHLLVSALGKLRDDTSWVALIAGGAQRPQEEKYLSQLKAEAESLGIADRIKFLGHRSDIYDIFAASDIYCQANAEPEPFGIVFVEALYSGLPVVTISIGGGAEIVDGSCGKLVPPQDARALSEALRSLILDPNARKTLGAGGPKRAYELCDPQKQFSKLSKILSGLI